ncbi:MAG: hypothetical protein H2070_00995 [Congregibacter sp.]|nr:hypothetical protein [Congregibacter sp.]
MRSVAGFSLVECLIANALVLAMVAALVATSASAISGVQRVAAKSDQSLRLGQIDQFLDAAMSRARMPQGWMGGDSGSKAVIEWPAPADPCQPPDAAGPLKTWGGLDIIELSDAPCLPGSALGKALYLEMIHPCFATCDDSAGYRLRPTECEVRESGEAVPTGPWWVDWQDSVVGTADCTEGAAWGRLERMVLSHRDVAGATGAPELRLHVLARGPIYRWTQAEVLVSGIREWQIQRLEVLGQVAQGQTGWSDEALIDSPQNPPPSIIQLALTVDPFSRHIDLPPLRAVRLLIPSY